MPAGDRDIYELLADYAGALRDGGVATFLRSLSRTETQRLTHSTDFRQASRIVQILNSIGFAGKVVTPDVGLFTSRVNARIASRYKKAKKPLWNRCTMRMVL